MFDWTTRFIKNIELDPLKKRFTNLLARPMAETIHIYTQKKIEIKYWGWENNQWRKLKWKIIFYKNRFHWKWDYYNIFSSLLI